MRSLLALAALVLSPSIAAAQLTIFDFDSGPGTAWEVRNDGDLWTIDIDGPNLRIAKKGDDLSVLPVDWSFGGIESAFRLIGDYEITVDYQLTTFPIPTPGPSQLNDAILGVVDDEGGCLFEVLRFNHSIGQKRIEGFDCVEGVPVGPTPVTAVTEYSGRFRLTRAGTTHTAWYALPGSDSFINLGSVTNTAGPVRIQLAAAQGGPTRPNSAIDIAFDDLIIDGTIEGPLFVRGDCNGIGTVDLADAITILSQLFSGAPPPSCADACDMNDDGAVNIADSVFLLAALFQGAGPLRPPSAGCGLDPTEDDLQCETVGGCQ